MPDAGRIHVDHVHIWQLPNHQDIREGTAYSVQTCSGCGESKPYNIAGDYPDTAFNMGETPVSADKSDVAFNPARRGPGRPRAEQPADPPTKELDEDHGKVASETREQTGAMGDKRRQCTNGCGRISWSDGLCATCYRDRYEALAASILVVNGDAKNTNEEPTLAPMPVSILVTLTLGLQAVEQDLQELQAIVDSFRMVVAFYEGRSNDD